MPEWFRSAYTSLVDPSTFRVVFLDEDDPAKGHWAGSEAGELTIRLRADGPEAGTPYEVTLRVKDGMTPSFLQRFPWGKWLTAADASSRSHGQDVEAATEALMSSQPKRPGRRGHDPAFLPAVARRYDELRRDGARSPVQTIADEHQVSRNTAAGWIKQARDKDLLPKARRPGKAG
jgi:hypothetical protein